MLEILHSGRQTRYLVLRAVLLVCEMLWIPVFISGLARTLSPAYLVPLALLIDAAFLTDMALRLRLRRSRRVPPLHRRRGVGRTAA